MGCNLSYFKFNNNKSYKVAETAGEDRSTNHGRKSSKKQYQQQQQQQYKQQLQQKSDQQLEKPLGKNVLPLSNQSFIYKTVLEATVSDATANEEEERINAAEAPGPFEIETDLLSPEVEEAVIKIQANVRGYLTRKQYRGVTPDRSVETSQQQPSSNVEPSQEPIVPSNEPRSSSGILAPPPSFSDTPKEFPLDHDDDQTAAANQGKKIAEKLVELEKQVSRQAINKPLESTLPTSAVNDDDLMVSEKGDNFNYGIGKDSLKKAPVDCTGNELKSQCENNHQQNVGGDDDNDEGISSFRSLEIPSIETSGPEEAAIKIQAAFRGYQVRKTISRETSPCQTREGGEDGAEVHFREKDVNSTHDPERESILVLNQLEECLSQELMRSSINLEDETSLCSYSTDIDLNASLQSNISLMALTSTTNPSTYDNDNVDLKLASIGSVDLLETDNTINNQLVITTIDDEPSIPTTIPDSMESLVNNEQIVDSPLISTIHQVPIDVSPADCPVNQSVDCLHPSSSSSSSSSPTSSSKVEDKIETIKTEPVLFVPRDGKVNAIDPGTILDDDSLKNDQEIDPVVIVELDGKLDASSNISESNDQPIKDLKSVEPESTKESATERNDTKSESTQLIDDTFKSQVDSESTTSQINKTTSSTHLNQSSEEIVEPDIEPLFFDMISPLTESKVENSSNQVNLPENFEKITSPDVQPLSSLSETVISDKQSDLYKGDNKSIDEIDDLVQESQQKVIKLIKEDSFGSDILILDDEKSDTLYDPFTDDLTSANSSIVNRGSTGDDDEKLATSSSFVDENLIQSVVDDINKDEGLLLYELHSKSTNANQTISHSVELPDISGNITEVNDDILVNLDESDEEDDDSQKRPAEESNKSKSTIRINIQRPSDAQEVEQLFQEKSKYLSDSFKALPSEEQSIEQSSDDNLVEEKISNEIISLPEQSARQNETIVNQSPDVSLVTTKQIVREDVVQKSEEQLKGEDLVGSSQRVESVQQSTINHDKSSIENVDGNHKISTNPFLNQPDFDSDIESGKINLNDQGSGDSTVGQTESTAETIEQPSEKKESTSTIQRLESTMSQVEVVANKDDEKSLETIVPNESRLMEEDNQSKISVESSIVNEKFTIQSVETTDLKSTITKDNALIDVELTKNQENEENSLPGTQLKPLIQENLKETLIVTETESSNQSTVEDEKLTPLESSTDSSASASSSTVNQPAVIVEPIDVGYIEQKVPTINETSVNDELERGLEEEGDEASPSEANLLLRLQGRETRSRSPNPFCGRKKRRQKKNRGGANN